MKPTGWSLAPVGAVRGWRAEADAAGLSRSEQDRMAPAFEFPKG